MTAVILFVFGAIVGSFLNVAGLRYNSGLTLGGRSSCASCGKALPWWELIPILGFLFLRGRCSLCRSRISFQYPLIELWTGLVFATIFNLQFPIFNKLILILVFCIYIVITIYDLRHKIIPDALVYGSICLALAGALISEYFAIFSNHYTLLDWLSGPIMAGVFALIWLLSRGKAMGFGDAKLTLSVGLLLGAAEGFSAIIVAFWIGALYGVLLILANRSSSLLRGAKKITMKSEIPFAPFIILGAWLAAILHLDLLHVSLF